MTDDFKEKKPALLCGQRVLLLFPHLVVPGGALHYALRLAEQLLAQGARVALLTLRVDLEAAIALPAGLELISLNGPLTSSLYYWLLFPFWQGKISRAISAWHADVLVPQVFPANWWGWLYKRRHPESRLVWVCQEPSAFIHSPAWISALQPWWKSVLARGLRPLLTAVDLALARYCDRIIANSRFTAAEIKRVYGVEADGVASPGIDFPAFAGQVGQRERALITVARLTRFKRVGFLLAVFREVLKVHPELIYHIVGQGEEELQLRELAEKLGLQAKVVFHGAVSDSDLAGLYRQASLFVHGSIGEPFGMAPLEAIASGTPVVAHNSGGPREFVTEDCGRLVASLAVEEWAREISRYLDLLFSHPDFSDRVRETARRFDWPQSLRPAVEMIGELCPDADRDHSLDPSAASPLISIIMPSYQQAPFLEEAVRSVLDQEEADVELLVMDPGSTDGSRALLLGLQQEYGERLLLHFAPDLGQSDAINRGMALARGRILAWLNSDDRLRPGALARVRDWLDVPQPRWLYGRAGMIDSQSRPHGSLIVHYKNWRGRRFSLLKLLTEDFIPQMAVFWNRSLWELAGPLDVDRHLDMDYDLWFRFAKMTDPLVLPVYLADFRVHGAAKGSRQTGAQLDAALITARQHAAGLGGKGAAALVLARLFSWRTRLAYRLLKPKG